jgi:hypothetical protein
MARAVAEAAAAAGREVVVVGRAMVRVEQGAGDPGRCFQRRGFPRISAMARL